MTRFRSARGALAALTLAAVADPGLAQTTVSLYGVVDLVAYSKQLAGERRIQMLNSGGLTTSQWGVKGSEDLGGGMSALFDLSAFLRADTGEAGRFNGDPYWGRAAWVGLSTPMGTVRAGRLATPTLVNTIRFNPFGDSTSLSPAMLHTYLASGSQPLMTGSGASDNAWTNSVGYTTPRWGGFVGAAMVAAGESAPAGRRVHLSGSYEAGPFAVGLALDKLDKMSLNFSKPPANLPMAEANTVNLGASYDFQAVKLFGQAITTTLENTTTRIELRTWQVGASVPVGAGRLLASWAQTTKDQTAQVDTKRSTLSLGYLHGLSKRTELYLVAMQDKLTAVSSGTGLAAGMRHRF